MSRHQVLVGVVLASLVALGCGPSSGRRRVIDTSLPGGASDAGSEAEAEAEADAPGLRDVSGGAADGSAAGEVKAGDATRREPTDGGGTATGECVPQCAGLACGPDGCGDQCGLCPTGQTCHEGQCECVPNCANKACGPDGCGGQCGSCGATEVCDIGVFECVPEGCSPSCAGNVCGSDGCGGQCGTCAPGASCQLGTCIPDCVPACGGKECGADGCGGQCGMCAPELVCDVQGQCVGDCAPSCLGKSCGSDGCDGSCGSCGVGKSCSGGQCVADCQPDCEFLDCGGDGCGGSCGSCFGGQTCDAGVCVSACIPSCGGKECGSDGCGGSCGSCVGGQACVAGSCAAVAPGQGDVCADPFVVGALPFSASGDSSGSADDYGYSAGACLPEPDGWGAGAPDQVWAFTPPSTATYHIALTSAGSFDSNLYVVSGCSDIDSACLAGDEQVCSGCTEAVDVALTGGVTVFIIVDGYGDGEAGGYTLTVEQSGGCAPTCDGLACGDDGCGGSCGSCAPAELCQSGLCVAAPPVDGDTCLDALPVGPVPVAVSGDTTGAANDYGLPAGQCPGEASAKGGASSDVVYRFTPAVSGDYVFTLTPSGWDSTLYVTTGCGATVGVCVGGDDELCSDCDEVVQAPLVAGTEYFVIVDGWSGVDNISGAFALSIDKKVPLDPPGDLVLNELLADPDGDAVLGDANCDGVRDASDDEFVELVNGSANTLDLSGAVISDGVSGRHTFVAGTSLPPGAAIVVFGGGSPFTATTGAAWCTPLPTSVTVVTASSGALGLNNGGDSITVVSALGEPLAALSYGGALDGGQNQSLVRSPELTGPFVLHTSVSGNVGPQSPGRTATGGNF